jgi:hypothetical protein
LRLGQGPSLDKLWLQAGTIEYPAKPRISAAHIAKKTTVEDAVRAELAELILTGSRVELPALIGLTGFNMVSQHAAVDSSQGSRTQATSKVEKTAAH